MHDMYHKQKKRTRSLVLHLNWEYLHNIDTVTDNVYKLLSNISSVDTIGEIEMLIVFLKRVGPYLINLKAYRWQITFLGY